VPAQARDCGDKAQESSSIRRTVRVQMAETERKRKKASGKQTTRPLLLCERLVKCELRAPPRTGPTYRMTVRFSAIGAAGNVQVRVRACTARLINAQKASNGLVNLSPLAAARPHLGGECHPARAGSPPCERDCRHPTPVARMAARCGSDQWRSIVVSQPVRWSSRQRRDDGGKP